MPPKKKPVKKEPVEPVFPAKVYGYFVQSYDRYGYRRTKRTELRMVTSLSSVPANKKVAVFGLNEVGMTEKTVKYTIKKTVK